MDRRRRIIQQSQDMESSPVGDGRDVLSRREPCRDNWLAGRRWKLAQAVKAPPQPYKPAALGLMV